MFIEKNGRNFVFGQPTIKGWSSVSPSRLIALTVSRLTAAKKCKEPKTDTFPYFSFWKLFFCLFLSLLNTSLLIYPKHNVNYLNSKLYINTRYVKIYWKTYKPKKSFNNYLLFFYMLHNKEKQTKIYIYWRKFNLKLNYGMIKTNIYNASFIS